MDYGLKNNPLRHIIQYTGIILTCCLCQTCADRPSSPTTEAEGQRVLVNDGSRDTPQAYETMHDRDLAETGDTVGVDYLMGKFDPAKHPDFVAVAPELTDGDGTYYLRREAYEAFRRMHEAAKADGVKLEIISATRNFYRQKQIWEAKWVGERLLEGTEHAPTVYPKAVDRARAILRWSSMPGSSRHHWGTDMDLNDLNNSYFEQGEGRKVYDWLTTHAADYGFCQPYSAKGPERPHGYNEEKWHWSYMPLSRPFTERARQHLSDEMIQDFKGSEAAKGIGIVEKYVLGINPACLLNGQR